MRRSPAYQAIKELRTTDSLDYPIEQHSNSENNKFFLIKLPANNQALALAGINYQPTEPPHISIYKFYRPRESTKSGLSIIHYTWYGISEDTNVVLHAYFDRMARYINCQLKNRHTEEVIENISAIEEAVIRRHIHNNANSIFTLIHMFISQQRQLADTKVNQHLSTLEQISHNLKTQLKRYKHIANTIEKI